MERNEKQFFEDVTEEEAFKNSEFIKECAAFVKYQHKETKGTNKTLLLMAIDEDGHPADSKATMFSSISGSERKMLELFLQYLHSNNSIGKLIRRAVMMDSLMGIANVIGSRIDKDN